MGDVSPRGSARQDDKLHRLYFEGVANKAYKEKKANEAQEKKRQKEDKELTFQPNIDRKSPKKTGRDKSPVYTQNYKEHKERVSRVEENHQQTFTFRPKISPLSYELAKKRESRSPIHRKLYEEGLLSKEQNDKAREAVIKEMYPYSPRLPQGIDNHLNKRPKQNQKEFTERLLKEGTQREQKLVQQRAAERTGLDPKTGQKLFQPVIPHDKYYYKVKKMDDEKYNKSRSASRTPRNADSSQSSSTYRERALIQNNINNNELILRDIFEKLDSDKDGYISAQNIDLSQLDAKVLEALLDLMDFLENNQAKIDCNGFVLAINGLGLEEEIIKVSEA